MNKSADYRTHGFPIREFIGRGAAVESMDKDCSITPELLYELGVNEGPLRIIPLQAFPLLGRYYLFAERSTFCEAISQFDFDRPLSALIPAEWYEELQGILALLNRWRQMSYEVLPYEGSVRMPYFRRVYSEFRSPYYYAFRPDRMLAKVFSKADFTLRDLPQNGNTRHADGN